MTGNSDKGKIGNAVVNGVGLAGVKIKGKHVGINVAQAEKGSPATPFDPKNVDIDNALIGAAGIAGLDIDGEDVELNIGQDPKKEVKPTTTSTTKTEEEVNPKTTKTEEEVNPKATTGEGATIMPDPLADYARGPMYIEHIPGRSIYLGDTDYLCNCPGCAYYVNILYPEPSFNSGIEILERGLHFQDGKIFEQANIKPLSTRVKIFWDNIPGQSIKPRGPPSYGFDVICTHCAVLLMHKRDPIWCYNQLLQGKHLH